MPSLSYPRTHEKRSIGIRIRMTPAERAELHKRAAERHITMAELVRVALFETEAEAVRPRPQRSGDAPTPTAA